MSRRLHPDWRVLASPENPEHTRCVDIFRRPDGSCGFEEFRRDPEDQGAWTPLAYFSALAYPSPEAALAAARAVIPWLAEAARMADDPKSGEGRKQLAERAAEQTRERDHAHHISDQYESSAGVLQISIVLASVSVVAKIKPLAIVAAILGIGAAVFSLLVTLGKI